MNTTAQQDDAQDPQNTPETTEETTDQQQPQDGTHESVNSDQEPQDGADEPEDWAKLTKTRSEAAGLRRRLRDTEAERDQSTERVTELEAKVAEYEAADEQREVDMLRRRVLTERNFPESTLELLTGTTEDEIIAELDRAVAILTQATPGPILRGTTGQPPTESDWSSVVKGR